MKRLLTLLLCFLLLLGLCPWAMAAEDEIGAASAGAYSPEQTETPSGEDCPDEPALDGAATLSLKDLSVYKHNEAYAEKKLCKGVDVSVFQGDIDWAAVKAAGVDFAIIRLGGRYSRSGAFYADSKFEENVSGALAQGLDVGAYYFSQAISEEEARQEAARALDILGSYADKLTMPVYLDVEYVGGGRLYEAGLSTEEQTDVALAFCDEMKKAGVDAGVYAAFCSFGISGQDIADAGYELWHAQWYTQATIDPIYTVWQFSDQGVVDGISGTVDLDFRYVSLASLIKISKMTGIMGESFSDVQASDWFYSSVNYVVESGFFNGVGDGKFNPSGAMKREMFATVLYRLAGQPEISGKSSFSDVTDESAWYYKAVVWGAENGIINGVEENRFGLGQSLSRQEMVTLLWRYNASRGIQTESEQSLTQFADADSVAAWAGEAMCWAVEQGIITGVSSGSGSAAEPKLMPASVTTRAQVAAVIQRFASLTAK